MFSKYESRRYLLQDVAGLKAEISLQPGYIHILSDNDSDQHELVQPEGARGD